MHLQNSFFSNKRSRRHRLSWNLIQENIYTIAKRNHGGYHKMILCACIAAFLCQKPIQMVPIAAFLQKSIDSLGNDFNHCYYLTTSLDPNLKWATILIRCAIKHNFNSVRNKHGCVLNIKILIINGSLGSTVL